MNLICSPSLISYRGRAYYSLLLLLRPHRKSSLRLLSHHRQNGVHPFIQEQLLRPRDSPILSFNPSVGHKSSPSSICNRLNEIITRRNELIRVRRNESPGLWVPSPRRPASPLAASRSPFVFRQVGPGLNAWGTRRCCGSGNLIWLFANCYMTHTFISAV